MRPVVAAEYNRPMLPIILIPAVVIGRWWTVIAASVLWPILLVGTLDAWQISTLLGGAVLAAVNAVVGVAVHQMIRRVLGRGSIGESDMA